MGGRAGDEDERSTLVFELSEADLDGETERLDVALTRLCSVSRSQVKRWIDAGRVQVDGETARSSARVSAGTILEATPPPVVSSSVVPEDIPLSIQHEDDDLIVLDKAAGMVVHPAPGHHSGTLVNALLHHSSRSAETGSRLATIGGVERPGIVHRLDRGTSGVMVVAKNDAAHTALAEQFHDHTILRVYRAVVRSPPGSDAGRIDRPIGRHRTDRKRMSVRTRSGRAAVTNWRTLQRFPKSQAALLEIRPETGRTHQIRVHFASSGMPIWGDPVYGKARSMAGPEFLRPALHAAVLGFEHPSRREQMRFEAPFPDDMTRLIQWLAEREE